MPALYLLEDDIPHRHHRLPSFALQHPFMKTSTGGTGLVQVIEGAKKAAAKNNELLE
jgi:hypothetical protein